MPDTEIGKAPIASFAVAPAALLCERVAGREWYRNGTRERSREPRTNSRCAALSLSKSVPLASLRAPVSMDWIDISSYLLIPRSYTAEGSETRREATRDYNSPKRRATIFAD